MKAIKVNADYEMQLQGKKSSPSINQSIEFLAFFLNEEPLCSEKKYPEDYLQYVSEVSGHLPTIVSTEACENWWGSLNDLEREIKLNSKLTSAELNQKISKDSLPLIIRSKADFELLQPERDYLIKSFLSMSGQKIRILSSALSMDERRKILESALQDEKEFILDPLLNRQHDFSHLVFEDKRIICYENLVDVKFQYKGTLFKNYLKPSIHQLSFYHLLSNETWEAFQEELELVINHYHSLGAEKGFSIDSFSYLEEHLRIRSLSEVNYRKTMGCVAFDLSHRYGKERPWSMLFLLRPVGGFLLLKKMLSSLLLTNEKDSGVIILSPGDARFDMLFLSAENEASGKKLFKSIIELLPSGHCTIKI